MKTSICYSLILATAALSGVALGQSATTSPVGYVSLGNTSGGDAVPANTDVVISIPLLRSTEFAGAALSVAGSVLTVSGAPAWTANQFLAEPYCLTVKSGAQEGAVALITANTANSLTLSPVTGSLAGVAANDQVMISKCWTLLSLLPLANIPNGTQLLSFDGASAGINLSASQVYTKAPTGWVQIAGGTGNANNVILHSGESFILRTGASPIPSLVVSGEVPTFNSRVTISKLTAAGTGQDNRLTYNSPVGEPIGSAGIPASNGDQLLIFNNSTTGRNKSASTVLVKSPAGWVGILGVSGNQDAFQIGAGQGYVYRRASSAPIGDLDWSDEQAYIPSL